MIKQIIVHIVYWTVYTYYYHCFYTEAHAKALTIQSTHLLIFRLQILNNLWAVRGQLIDTCLSGTTSDSSVVHGLHCRKSVVSHARQVVLTDLFWWMELNGTSTHTGHFVPGCQGGRQVKDVVNKWSRWYTTYSTITARYLKILDNRNNTVNSIQLLRLNNMATALLRIYQVI